MKRLVFLDAGIVGILCNPNVSSDVEACNRWLETHLAAGTDVWLPEIADFEVRRELIHLRKNRSLARLDGLKQTLEYAPITTEIMLRAARLWQPRASKVIRPRTPRRWMRM